MGNKGSSAGKLAWIGLDGWTLESSSQWDPNYCASNLKYPLGDPWHDGQHGIEQWVSFHKSHQVTISGFKVQRPLEAWKGSGFTDFKFQYSNDNENWQTALSGQGANLNLGAIEEFTFAPVSARYWRLYMADNWGYGYLAIQYMELLVEEAWSTLDDGWNLEASSQKDDTFSVNNLRNEGGQPWHDGQGGENQWIQFDNGRKVTLSGCRVGRPKQGFEGSAFKQYKLEYSNDAETWTTAMESESEDLNHGEVAESRFPPIMARYWRLFMKDNWGYNGLTIQYIEVIAAPEVWSSLEGWNVAASSQLNQDYPVENLLREDGNPWHDGQEGKDQWISFDKGLPVNVSGCHIKRPDGWPGSAFKEFELMCSSDNEIWETAFAGTGSNFDFGKVDEFRFPPRTAQFWKLKMTDNWGYGALTIQFIEILSSEE
mmetsp:Transcript_1393/g.1896  ORF Transcript_1393/g.1896 Transcript_1393/m.1896 type:complete len:428 (-) Transcript_1393:282-1565(-)